MPLRPVPARILPLARAAAGGVVIAAGGARRTPRRVRAWAVQPISSTRGTHVGYFSGYTAMAIVAVLAILHHR